MRYFLDTEFIEEGKTIDLISISLVAEDGRELYCENQDVDWTKASDWVLSHVKPQLWSGQPCVNIDANRWTRDGGVGGLMPYSHIGGEIRRFCSIPIYGKPEFWGYYADYDWVVFCWLFGRMIDLPQGFPKYCNDIKQLACDLGNPELPKQVEAEHHALTDARWNKQAYDFLKALEAQRG